MSGSEGIINIAPAGQWRAQLPQSTPSVRGTQFSFIQTARPIWMADLSAFVIGRMAPAGQTSAQRVHSKRQYPRSYDISGCINVIRLVEGRSTWLGQTETQSWQAVQCCVKFRMLWEPGGVIGVERFGIFLSSITASPPSTFFSCAFRAEAVANVAPIVRKRRRLSVGRACFFE